MQPISNRRDAAAETESQSRAVVTIGRHASALARRQPHALAIAGRRASAAAVGAAALGAAALGAITVGGTIGGAWKRRSVLRSQRPSPAVDIAPEPVAMVVQMSVLVIERFTVTDG